MTSPNEFQMSIIAAGRTASAVLREARPVLESQAADALARLKSLYRAGTFTESKLVALVAELCAIDELIERLDSRIEAATTVQKELHNA